MRRTALTAASVGLPIIVFVLSGAVIQGLDRFLENSAKQLRLAVTQKSSIINPLPAGHRQKIEALDPTHEHILSVCGMQWIGGATPNNPTPLSCLAADVDTFPETFSEYQLTPDELDAWKRDRQALVLGRAVAGMFGWKKGDRVTIRPSVPPYGDMEFHIVAIGEHAEDPVTNWLRRDYVQELLKSSGFMTDMVSFFFVRCASAADVEHYRHVIDDYFANSTDATQTQDEKTFMNQFITQQFNLPRNMRILAAVTVFVAIMAAANTMSMNFRDRIGELATLKAIGFGSSFIFGLIQAESLLVCLIGALLGALVPYIAFTYTPLKDYPVPLIQHLDISPMICGIAMCVALGVAILAATGPSILAMRLRVVSALRMLE